MGNSLFEHLMDTMPFAGVEGMVRWHKNQGILGGLSSKTLAKFLRYLDRDEDYEAKNAAVAIPDDPSKSNDERRIIAEQQRLWGWKHKASQPAKITDVYCRVRNAGYAQHLVLESIEWGLEDPIDTFEHAVRITNACGEPIKLPLTNEFLQQKWLTKEGWITEDMTSLWKLEHLLDFGIVLLFVYEIDAVGQPQPLQAHDQHEAEALQAVKEAAEELLGSPKAPPAKPLATEIREVGWNLEEHRPIYAEVPVLPPTWREKITKDSIMGPGQGQGVLGGQAGAEACQVKTSAARMLVILSLSVCRERSTFEPGGVVGAARIYPHVMVKATVPLAKIEASIRYNRPAQTTTRKDDGSPGEHSSKGCCQALDGSDGEIGAVLITDANLNPLYEEIPGDWLPTINLRPNIGPPQVFWSNLFNYYMVDAYYNLRGYERRMKMVRSDRPVPRVSHDGWVQRDIVGWVQQNDVRKVARQGEFDNVHIAPKMKLLGAGSMAFANVMGIAPKYDIKIPVDFTGMKLDAITMAPFCAHDCLHTHWRWADSSIAKWVLGWDETGPYKIAGAPMIPLNQDIEVWLRSAHTMTYHAIIAPIKTQCSDEAQVTLLPAGELHVIMHHGSAYGCYMTGQIEIFVARYGFDIFAPPPRFLDHKDQLISCLDSYALFFWWARYSATFFSLPDGTLTYELIERTRTTEDGLRSAREL